jgi:hypothetical protein
MSKGKKRPLKKIRFRKPPPIVDPEDAEDDELVDFSKMQPRKQLRLQRFCQEYIKDFNAAASVQRMGYPYDRLIAAAKGTQFLAEPYSQYYLGELMQKCEEAAIVTKNEILFGLKRESNYYGIDGSAPARISALRSLAKILGLEITKVQGNIEIGGGVMALPFTGSLEQWEEACKSAQAKLKEDVRK